MTQHTDIYQSPAAPVAPAALPVNSEYVPVPIPVSMGIRFLNYMIDYVAMFALATIVAAIVAVVMGEGVLDLIDRIPNLVLGIGVSIIYYIFFEGIWGRTIGKLITRTKVVTTAGYTPGFGAILKRTFARHIPFEALSFLGNNGWHDRMSDTLVVSTK